MDGKVIIGTELDDKGFDKGLEEIQKQDASIKLKLDIAELDKQYQEIQKKIDDLNKKAIIEYSGTEGNTWEFTPNLSEEEIQEYDRLTDLLDEIWAKKEQLLATQEQINGQITQQVNIEETNLDNIDKWVNGVMTLEDGTRLVKIDTEELAKESRKIDFTPIKDSVENVGNSIEKAIKKVSRWALAIFGIRSAYMFVRQAMSTLSQYDDQMATNIQYIRYLLASALKPIIETIINLAYKLLAYINAIAQAWFGVNLFANASTKAFEKQNKALGGSVKQAKQLQKTIAGFDEMNVLQDNGNVGSGGGGGATMPTLPNFPKLEDIPIPSWLQWIIDHKDEVLSVFAGIIAFLKLAPKLVTKFGAKLGLLKALGIGVAIAGIVYSIQGLLEYLKNPTWENFGQIIQGIGIAVIGLGIAFFGLPAVIVGVVVLIYGTIVKYWDKIKATLQKGIDWLKNQSDFVHKYFGEVIGQIYDFFVRTFQRILDYFNTFIVSVRKIFDGVIEFLQGIFTLNWKKVVDGLGKIFSGMLDILLGKFKLIFNSIKDYFGTIVNSIKSIITGLWSTFTNGASTAWKKITGLFSKGGQIFNGIKDGIANVFKTMVNAIITGINTVIKIPFNKVNSLLNTIRNTKIPVINKKPFAGLWSNNPLPIPKIPKLAVGGIINQPGRGVAIGGERGAEAVVPLTDSQQMALLGEAIGKYITIDLTNITQLDGRQIARKVEQINQNNRFVLNR